MSEHRQRETTHARHVLGAVAFADSVCILIERMGVVQNLMSRFDCPLIAIGRQHSPGRGLIAAQGRHAVSDLDTRGLFAFRVGNLSPQRKGDPTCGKLTWSFSLSIIQMLLCSMRP